MELSFVPISLLCKGFSPRLFFYVYIKIPVFPILTYYIELWFNSANQFERDKLLKLCDINNFDTDITFLVERKIFNTATNILVDNEHIWCVAMTCIESFTSCLELELLVLKQALSHKV